MEWNSHLIGGILLSELADANQNRRCALLFVPGPVLPGTGTLSFWTSIFLHVPFLFKTTLPIPAGWFWLYRENKLIKWLNGVDGREQNCYTDIEVSVC